LEKVVEEYDLNAQKSVQKFVSKFEEEKNPPLIYHYTNDIGLDGILDKGELWLTDASQLNDPSEILYGFSHILDLLKKAVSSTKCNFD